MHYFLLFAWSFEKACKLHYRRQKRLYLQCSFPLAFKDYYSYLWRRTIQAIVFLCRSLSWVLSLKSCLLQRIMWHLRTASCMWRDSCTRCHLDLGEKKLHSVCLYLFEVINIPYLVLLSSSGVVRTSPPFSRPMIQSVLKEILIRKGTEEDESVHAFVSRRLGSEVRTRLDDLLNDPCCPCPVRRALLPWQISLKCVATGEVQKLIQAPWLSLSMQLADLAIDSLCRGVFAGDCRQLSVRSCFPPLYKAEQSWGSIVLGMLMGSGEGAEGSVV